MAESEQAQDLSYLEPPETQEIAVEVAIIGSKESSHAERVQELLGKRELERLYGTY